MRTLFLLAMPLALVTLLAGCDEAYQSSAPSRSSGQASASASKSSATAPAAAPAAPAPASRRNTTTQPLPSGWGYIHEQDLAGGGLRGGAATTAAPVVNNPNTGG